MIGFDGKAEQKVILADIGDGGRKPASQRFQIESSATFVDLNGVAAAEGHVGLGLALEIREFMADASAARWVLGDADGLEVAGPNVARDQAAVERFFAVGEKFEGFGDFERGNEVDDGAEDADSVASFFEAVTVGGRFEEAGEARGDAGTDGHGDAVTCDSGGVNPGAGGLDGVVVDEEAGFEIISAVEDEVEACEEILGVARAEVGDDTFDNDGGIDGAEFAFGGNGFGKSGAGVAFVEESLAL